MKNFKNKEERLDYILTLLDMHEDIEVICNYQTVLVILEEFLEDNYEDKSINIDSDINNYSVNIIKNKCFCIEPLKRDGQYYYNEAKMLLIEEEIFNLDEKILNYCDYEDIEILKIGKEKQCQLPTTLKGSGLL